jgi:hypothetical protein
MRAPLWWLEVALTLRRRRLLVLNVAIPLLLVLPVALGGAPAFHAAAVYTVLFVLFGTFGAAIPLIRDGETGILRRMLLVGASPRHLLLARGIGGTLLDALQILPSLALILLVGIWQGGVAEGPGVGLSASPGSAGLALLAVPILLGALLAANLVGVWVAALARSLAEGALFAAVLSLFLLHGSGVFRTSTPGSVGAFLEGILPFGPLHRLLLHAAGGSGVGPETLVPLLSGFGGPLILLLVTQLAAPALIERISTPVR